MLDDTEEIFASIIYWIRNKKKTMQECLNWGCRPGPKGSMNKKGIWVPDPEEACDCLMEHTIEGKGARYLHPYEYWKHSKTKQHIRYLVKYRRPYLLWKFASQADSIDRIIKAVCSHNVPFLINSDIEFIKIFAHDALAGHLWDIPLRKYSSKKEIDHEKN